MSQTGYTPIQLYRTTTASAAPAAGNLADGELAINTNDGKLFYKDSVGNVQTLAAKATGTIGGSTTQVQYNSSGSLAGSSNFTFDGTNVQIGSQGDLRLGDADNSNWVAFQAPAVVGSNVTWTLPATDGSPNQVLSTSGSGVLSWATTVSTPGGSDTQLQYNSSNTFAGATGLTTDGTNLTVRGQGDVRFADADSSNWVAFQAPATIASNVTWTLPSADGTSNQVLSTNGTGTLSWVDQTGGGGGGGVSVTRTQFTATAGQTTFSVTYTVGQLDVYLNGALLAAADYTATNGTSVVLTSGAALNDILTTVAYNSATQIIQGDTSVAVSDSGSNGTIIFKTDNVEAMRVTSGQLVGIGTNSPARQLTVYEATLPIIALQNSTTGTTVNDGTLIYVSGSDAAIKNKEAAGGILFHTGGDTERMRILAGAPILCLSGGNTSATGTGITFPATQSASSDVNTLDDYEEGTWTPTMYGSSSAGTTTYGTQAGKYTKVGNVVTVQCYLTWTNATGTGNMLVGGLPFASIAGTGFNQAGQIGYCANLTTPANTFPLFYLGQTNNYLEFCSVPIAGGTCSALAIDTAANVILGITYLAAT